MKSASKIWLNDLHGNSTKQERSPEGGEDENPFQIKQGVAIALSVRLPSAVDACTVVYHERWGTRQNKEAWLSENHAGTHEWAPLEPAPDHYMFVPQSNSLRAEFQRWPSLPDVMPANGAGYITARDNLVLDFEKDVVVQRINAFNKSSLDDDNILRKFDISDKKGWDVKRARAKLKHVDISKSVIETNYRPFDSRWIFFDSTLVWGRSWPTMQHVLGHSQNLTLLATRMTKDQWDVWVSRTISSHKAMSAYDTNSIFPLYLIADSESSQRSFAGKHRVNVSAAFLKRLRNLLGWESDKVHGLSPEDVPEDIFHYAYAIFRSPSYRSRYSDFLKTDFPRLPLPKSAELFRALARIGHQVTSLHLLEAPGLDTSSVGFVGDGDVEIEKISWSKSTVWIDRKQTTGFRGVLEDQWKFHIGGYQVCEKWLKDRKGRSLSADDIAHYKKIVVAISETTRLMREIDEVIDEYGGWPDAFASSDTGG